MEYITIQEATRAIGCSDKTLRRAIEEGKLKVQPRERHNQPIIIAVDDLNAYIMSRRGVQVEPVAPVRLQDDQPAIKDATKMAVLEEKVSECLLTIKRLEERIQELETTRHPVQTEELDTRYLHQDFLLDFEQRMQGIEKQLEQLEKDQAHDLSTFHTRLERIDAKMDSQHELVVSGQFVQPDQSESAQTPVMEAPDDEWRITGNGIVRYHDTDPARARRRLDTFMSNEPGTKWQLHRPVFTPSKSTAVEITEDLPSGISKQIVLTSGESLVFLQDFNQPRQAGYFCEATHRDVKASLAVLPVEGTHGYAIRQPMWDKVSPMGKLGKNQEKRAQTLLATLEAHVREEMQKANWTEVNGIWQKD